MIYKLFDKLYREAKEYNSEEMFIMERGWQSWMDDYRDGVGEMLKKIWELAKCDIKQLREGSGMTMRELAAMFNIPQNTAYKWQQDANHREPPEYLAEFIAYALFIDWLHRGNRPGTAEYLGGNIDGEK